MLTVYKLTLGFHKGAVHGDELEVRSTATLESDYRAVVAQEVWRRPRVGGQLECELLVKGVVELIWRSDGEREAVGVLPGWVRHGLLRDHA